MSDELVAAIATATDIETGRVLRSPSQVFNYADADIILRSCDETTFRVHKTVLSLSSRTFRDMFELSQGDEAGEQTEDEVIDGLRVVPMTEETEEVVELLLRLNYPDLRPPTLDTVDQLKPVLQAAIKYQMDEIATRLWERLMKEELLKTEPVRVFAIALRFERVELARKAAIYATRQPMIGPEIAELAQITGLAYHRLLAFRQKCIEAATYLARSHHWNIGTHWVWFRCTSTYCTGHTQFISIANQQVHPRAWWVGYMAKCETALSSNACGATVTSGELLWPSLQSAASCGTCRSEAFTQLKMFSERFANEIDIVISKMADATDFNV